MLESELAFGVLVALARLGVADLIAEAGRPLTSSELSEQTDADPDRMARLLRTAAALGYLRTTHNAGYALTSEGALLRDLPGSLRPALLVAADPLWRETITNLGRAVLTGKAGTNISPYDYLTANPALARQFQQFMAVRSAAAAAALAQRDFTQCQTVIDIGGGQGAMLSTILEAHPHLTGVLWEQESVADIAVVAMAERGHADRCQIIAGDMIDNVPHGGQQAVYILSNILHNLDDGQAHRVLSNVRAAASNGPAQVWCVDMLINPYRAYVGTPAAELTDMRMMSLFLGGRERTSEEYLALLINAGFPSPRIERLSGPMYLISSEVTPLSADDAGPYAPSLL
ncbi:methyltransferase [Streptosporangium sp. NPDC020072]|uniref:methyltransferase n=1 Tax=Streptosporangium sp. NPDC020072 TaxID=3154788 RepID=UPI0034479826